MHTETLCAILVQGMFAIRIMSFVLVNMCMKLRTSRIWRQTRK